MSEIFVGFPNVDDYYSSRVSNFTASVYQQWNERATRTLLDRIGKYMLGAENSTGIMSVSNDFSEIDLELDAAIAQELRNIKGDINW